HYLSAVAEAQEAVAGFQARGVRAVALRADLSREEEVGQLFGAAAGQLGRVDVLVNCAAVWQPARLEDVRAADLRLHFDVNVLGSFLCARAAGLMMVRQPEGGGIINLGGWAEARPSPTYAAYFASKGCIPTLTRCLAVELGTRNPRVRVNAVLPGPVLIPADLPEAERQEAIDATLVRREGSPENVAGAVLALVANDFITVACLPE